MMNEKNLIFPIHFNTLKGMAVKVVSCMFVFFSMVIPAAADGFIVLPNPVPVLRTPFPLEVSSHIVDVSIDGLSAETSIDQVFFNPTSYRLEGYYIFPVPKNALIRKFTMEIDGKETEAELLDATKARIIYEDIVRRQLDPALLEYSDRSMFKVRIFPIEPKSKKRIRIKYQETLSIESGSIEYLYPLNTEKFSSGNLEKVRVRVDIRSDSAIGGVFCPTHPAVITREGNNRVTAEYEEHGVKPDSDFKLLYSTGESKVGAVFRAYNDGSGNGFFFLNASPSSDEKTDVIAKDIVFALDTSGSMAGDKIGSAKRALNYCVKNLNRGDRFQIVRFSTETEQLFSSVEEYTPDNMSKAVKFIDGFRALGGTNIEEALRVSVESLPKDTRPKMIVFITDGKPTLGETDDDRLMSSLKKMNVGMTRIFTFGIGYDINTHLLDRITDTTRSYRTYISPREDIEKEISAFYAKIQSPVMTDITVKIPGMKTDRVYPKELPDLYRGSSLSVFGRYSGDGKSAVVIEGKIKGKAHKFSIPAVFPAKNTESDFIPPLWASRRVGFLLDQMRLYGESREVIDEIVNLARTYGILTPYTSYLILEDEQKQTERRDIPAENLAFSKALPAPQVMKEEYGKKLAEMKNKSGEGSIDASRSVQQMNDAENVYVARKQQMGSTRYDAKQPSGNMNQILKNIRGITFYQAGKVWIDSRISSKKSSGTRKIVFASEEYFSLAAKYPDAKEFLSIGRYVRFVIGDTMYEIID